ncbi:MAG: tetratricopeptide repeat protein [Sphingomonadales bacterium]|nr:MAG: tetratricopeptide repeat protein [Sphingomonadales bacterium]TNF01754.1 MAG: tetratricopeptide repeat protein [Sphingomonadales bacterium]
MIVRALKAVPAAMPLVAALLLPTAPAFASREPVDMSVMQLDSYARARLAEADGALVSAASAYREAVKLDPASVEVAGRGYRQAVLAGDKALALQTAHILDAAGRLPRDGVVVLLIDAMERRKWHEASVLVDRLESETNLAFLVPFMRSWVSLAERSYDPPVVPLDASYAVFAVRYLEEQLLLQRLALGDRAGLDDAYAQAKGRKVAFGPEERAMIAARFAGLGREDLALDILTGGSNAGSAEQAAAALKQAKKLYRKRSFSPRYGLALLMQRLTNDLAGQGEGTATLSIARIASFADPANDDIRVNVARIALAADYSAMADTEAGRVAASSPAWFDAQTVRLRALLDQDRMEEAVAHARTLVDLDGGSVRSLRLFGDVQAAKGDFAAAADAYGRARQAQGEKEDAALLLQLGGALEQAGNWPAAKPILERVVELAPDSAVALNHLGYALADRREDLPRAIALLEKANRIRPGEAAFVDSLGWAFYRSGAYDKALPLIERAAMDEPANSELNEHLGDVLWAAGRRFEARYAWQAALVGLGQDDGEAEMRERLSRKIDGRAVPARP